MPSALEFWILLVSGIITAILALQFVFPNWYSTTFNKLELGSVTEVFYARQGGLGISMQGILLIAAAFMPELRVPVILVVGSGKLIFASWLWLNLKKFSGLLVTALVDSVSVLAFLAILLWP